MDKIRKALDLARLERTLPGESSRAAEVPRAAVAGVSALRTLPTSIVYTHTRVFSPSADALEDNRIMCPASAYPGAAAFRMLRTQVLQRMDANGWRSLAILSPAAADGFEWASTTNTSAEFTKMAALQFATACGRAKAK